MIEVFVVAGVGAGALIVAGHFAQAAQRIQSATGGAGGASRAPVVVPLGERT